MRLRLRLRRRRMRCEVLVLRSLAGISNTPFASMWDDTSICGTPRGAGGMPASSNCVRLRLSAAIQRSPRTTCTGTKSWLSALVVKISLFSVGMLVLRE